jgi:hypothetical protein
MKEMFVPSLIEIGQMFHFKRFSPIYKCKIIFPLVSPTLILGTIICTSLNVHYVHYVRKLSCKYDLFWLSGSQGKHFSMTSPNFLHFCDYFPFEEDLALYL